MDKATLVKVIGLIITTIIAEATISMEQDTDMDTTEKVGEDAVVSELLDIDNTVITCDGSHYHSVASDP